MKIAIEGKHIEITPALEEYILRRFEPLAKLAHHQEIEGELFMRVDVERTTRHHYKGDVFLVSASVPFGKTTLRIEQEGEDMHQAIDDAQKRLKLLMEEKKERAQTKDRVAIDKAKMKL